MQVATPITTHLGKPPAAEVPPRQNMPIQLQVLATGMEAAGLNRGDILTVQPLAEPQNGQLVVLHFDGRMVIRRYVIQQYTCSLQPLHGHLQTLHWPLHMPIPLVGVVTQLTRNMDGQ